LEGRRLLTASPATAGLLLWLDSTDTATVKTNSAGGVTSWANRAPSATNAVTYTHSNDNTTAADTSAPTYITKNGVKVVNFNGNGYLDNLSFSSVTPSSLTVFILGSAASNAGGYRAFMGFRSSSSSDDYQTGFKADLGQFATSTFSNFNVEGAKAGGNGGFNLLKTATTFNTFHTFQINYLQTISLSVDGHAQGSMSGNTSNVSLKQLFIGSRAYATGFVPTDNHDLNGQIAEVLVYNGALTGANLTQTQNYLASIFAKPAPATISGRVFDDANANKKLDTGEDGLGLWTVYIDRNNDGKLDAGDSSVTTDILGNWSFSNLSAGTYTIRIVPVAGLTTTTPTGGMMKITVAAGQKSTGNLFGERAS
jgi:hypothetical protein